VNPFSVQLPVRIRFGDGALGELGRHLHSLGALRPLVVCDASVRSLDAVERAVAGLTTLITAPGEPTVESADDLGEQVRAARADVVVAIGGGATIDAAKAARLVASTGTSIARHLWPGDPEPVPPLTIGLIAVPTTAGTGSEVTGGIVLLDPATRRKVAAPSPHNRPDVALVDPTLTHGLPPAPTLYGGVDAVAQGLAAVVCAARSPIGDALGLEAVRIGAPALRAVVADPTDAAARSAMACASLLAGLAMNVSEVGTEHSLAHALGSIHGLPHGLSVGLVLLASMEHDRQHVPERMERVADALGVSADGSRDGSRAVRGIRELLRDVAFPSAADLGLATVDVGELAAGALAGWIPVEPGPWTRADVEQAYRRSLLPSPG
jgi:alcohol dehydrogenase